MKWFKNNDKEINKLKDRIDKLERETKYYADKPMPYLRVGSAYDQSLNYYANAIDFRENNVAINDVVRALVKHLGIEIESVEEKVTRIPKEIKVVSKEKGEV